MISVRFDLPATGWVECVLSDGVSITTISASYLSDGFGDLAKATLSLVEGALQAECVFAEEPGAYHWKFAVEGALIALQIFWFDPEERGREDLAFQAQGRLSTFASVMLDELDRLHMQYGPYEFERRWGHPFPEAVRRRLHEKLG